MSFFYGSRIRKHPEFSAAFEATILLVIQMVTCVGLQLSVATAHAQQILHGSTVSMRKPFVTSVVYNLIYDFETILLTLNR